MCGIVGNYCVCNILIIRIICGIGNECKPILLLWNIIIINIWYCKYYLLCSQYCIIIVYVVMYYYCVIVVLCVIVLCIVNW